ncbi:hypothetical protein GII30_13775 [Gordonia amarae]|nr:hypothetical protein [Gordonia amarae]MCS3879466.1 hypothetical protein [Gordonia amarae]QHN17942.1 hypothetical protein GII35_14090 [Gordonia amarae]QHN22462.1 hypothetical protein GII34_13830 [Gordonia amarae]QHN31328.1 hypothetical protein GII32_13940 [Gordonia amarae]QHN40073.1 hypothetical protein GII30_13775 [Gordonia amarae]
MNSTDIEESTMIRKLITAWTTLLLALGIVAGLAGPAGAIPNLDPKQQVGQCKYCQVNPNVVSVYRAEITVWSKSVPAIKVYKAVEVPGNADGGDFGPVYNRTLIPGNWPYKIVPPTINPNTKHFVFTINGLKPGQLYSVSVRQTEYNEAGWHEFSVSRTNPVHRATVQGFQLN